MINFIRLVTLLQHCSTSFHSLKVVPCSPIMRYMFRYKNGFEIANCKLSCQLTYTSFSKKYINICTVTFVLFFFSVGNARGSYRSCPCASLMEICPISSSDDTQVTVKLHPGKHARTQAEVTVSSSLAACVCCSVFFRKVSQVDVRGEKRTKTHMVAELCSTA